MLSLHDCSFPLGSLAAEQSRLIVETLQKIPLETTAIATRLKLSESALMALLIDLELNGVIEYSRASGWQLKR
ncbi:MAG: hypothetical protein WC224_03145 [Sphaerochaetaceae bacterium]